MNTDATSPRLQKLKALLEKKPESAFGLYGLAMEHRSLQQYHLAAENFRQLLELHPEYTAAFLHFGNTLLDLGNESEALKVYLQGIEICRQQEQEHAVSELKEAVRRLG